MGKIFEKLKIYQDSIFLVSCIMLVGLIGFGLGRLSSKYQTAQLDINSTLVNTIDLDKIITTSLKNNSGAATVKNSIPAVSKKADNSVNREATASNELEKIVGNKNSKIYHLENCPGALKMKAENKIFFASILEAEQAGYRPAGNCSGLQ